MNKSATAASNVDGLNVSKVTAQLNDSTMLLNSSLLRGCFGPDPVELPSEVDTMLIAEKIFDDVFELAGHEIAWVELSKMKRPFVSRAITLLGERIVQQSDY